MNQGREPVEIFPMSLDMSDGIITDFRPLPLPSDSPEEEVTDPKGESAPGPVDSPAPESNHPTEQTPTGSPAPVRVPGVSSSPKGSETGS